MLYEVEASLTYDFAAPCEVLLQVEAADGPDQRVVSQALTFWPMMQSAQAEDPTTRQRRTIFQAFGRVNILYRAQVDILAREPDLSTLSAQAIRDLPGDVLPFLRASRYSPSDRMESFADREFGGLTGGRRVTAIVDWILKHVDYRAGVSPWLSLSPSFTPSTFAG